MEPWNLIYARSFLQQLKWVLWLKTLLLVGYDFKSTLKIKNGARIKAEVKNIPAQSEITWQAGIIGSIFQSYQLASFRIKIVILL